MRKANSEYFIQGLTAGVFGSFVGAAAVLYALARSRVISFPGEQHVSDWLHWAYANLGSSIPVFAVLLIAFFETLRRLRNALQTAQPTNDIAQLDHLTDTWITLFVGTGVIWTAIGMRSALLFALGDPSNGLQDGAYIILRRMVDGGILVALSTTIFGGVGGYMMRVYKSITLGSALQHCYDKAARADTSRMRDTLERIEGHLKSGTAPASEPADSIE